MLEVNMDRRLLLVLIGVFAVIGLISKCVVSISLKGLMKAAGNMGKSSHSLMRLVRAKYEHTCMVSDRVQNVEVFVEKYIYEYRIMRIRLHSWRRLERAAAWGCLVAGLVGAGIEYAFMGMTDFVLQSAGGGAAIGILLFLMRIAMDEEYCLNVIRTYMVDYLDNFCARKFEKSKELNNPERPRPREEVPSPTDAPEILPPVMPEPYQSPEPYRAPEAGTAAEGLRMAERREYAVDSRGERAIDNRRGKRSGDGIERAADRQAEVMAEQMDNRTGYSGNQEADTQVERISEKLMENIVETAVADTKWADVGAKEAKGKKTARGRKKEQQLAERLAEKAAERSVEAAERAAEKLAAEAGEMSADQKADKQVSALSKEVLIREILEEFLA